MRKPKLPKFNVSRGQWSGGDSHTLYAFTDKRTGHVAIHPGRGGSAGIWQWFNGIGPEVTVRVATRDEATQLWQNPLNKGWKVEDNYEIGSETSTYKRLLTRITDVSHFKSNFEADSLTMAVGRAYKSGKISGEERDLLASFIDARRG